MPDVNREAAIQRALQMWNALPEDERNGERPWIMGFNAGYDAALDRALEVAADPDIYSADDIHQAILALKEPT